MAALLDTDIVISFLTGDVETLRFVNALTPTGIAISTVTYMEVLHGCLENEDPLTAQAGFDAFLDGAPVLSFSPDIARQCAHIRVQLKRAGKRIRPRALDLMIAATAMHHNFELATHNTADYRDISGLRLVALAPPEHWP